MLSNTQIILLADAINTAYDQALRCTVANPTRHAELQASKEQWKQRMRSLYSNLLEPL